MLIIEDGTGLPDAQAYSDAAALQAYAALRGIDISAYDEPKQEAALVVGAQDWIDGEHQYRGEKLVEDQALSFPTDEDGLPDSIPLANIKAAILHLQGLLLVDLSKVSTSGQVTSEAKSVGSLSKSIAYKEGTAQVYSRVLPKSLINLLQPYFKFSGGFGSLKRW